MDDYMQSGYFWTPDTSQWSSYPQQRPELSDANNMNTGLIHNQEEGKRREKNTNGQGVEESRKRPVGRKLRDEFLYVDAEEIQMKMIESEEEIKQLHSQLSKIKKDNESLQIEVADMQANIRRLEHTNAAVQHRSNKITKEMALKMDNSRCLEDAGEFSGHNISQKLKTLYDHGWTSLYRNVGKELPDLQETEKITLLSELLKSCYDECNKMADMQLRQFLLLNDKESLPENKELQELMSARKKLCREKSFREKVTKIVLNNVYESSKVLDKYKQISAIKKELDDFYIQFTDCCWLLVISNPPIVLNFDVVGKSFQELKLEWTEYTSKQIVEDLEKEEGTVAVVVWPSLVLKDDSALYRKGDVVVVKKGKPVARKTEDSEQSAVA